jgi:hypothetical protein
MVDTKLIILFAPILLVGCATVPAPTMTNIPEPVKEVKILASAAPMLSPEPVYEELASGSLEMVGSSAVEITSVEATADPVPIAPAKKKVRLIDTVTSSIMSTAEAAVSDKKETIIYDATGNVKEKTVEVDKGSFVDNITKLVGLITATLGLYIGVKKFRQPDPRKV